MITAEDVVIGTVINTNFPQVNLVISGFKDGGLSITYNLDGKYYGWDRIADVVKNVNNGSYKIIEKPEHHYQIF